MKHLSIFILLIAPFTGFAQQAEYSITSYMEKGRKAPNTHHMGDAWLNSLLQADDDFQYNITQASFRANSTLDWHKHGTPQILIIVEGEGYYQERGKAPVIMKKGDVIKCEKDTEHWHTSTVDSDVTYLAVYGNKPTVWTEKLTREYYDSVARQLNKD